jgi:hypothetical protein
MEISPKFMIVKGFPTCPPFLWITLWESLLRCRTSAVAQVGDYCGPAQLKTELAALNQALSTKVLKL